MKLKAALFDLDGTLLDTLRDLAEAMNAVLRARSLPVHPTDAYRHLVGDGMVTLVARALPGDDPDPETVEACVAEMRAEYARRWDATTCPYDGVPELLDTLRDRAVPAAVFSNKPDDFTHRCVDRFLADWKFVHVRGARLDVPLKPDPAGALATARELGVRPDEVAYFGDTATDMRTACAAGMFPVGVLWGFRDEDELLAAGAEKTLSAPPQGGEVFD